MKFVTFDQYIDNSEEFAQPILKELRSIVHEACPEAEENFKWSFPNFSYKGKILCSMASFKAHASFGFWLRSHMSDPNGIFVQEENSGMGQLGYLKSVSDLPRRKVLVSYIHEAMRLTEEGKTLVVNKNSNVKKELIIPEILIEALNKNDKAKLTYENFSYSNKKEYAEWIAEAKTEATRLRRLDQALEWLEEGKSKNWKYQKS